MVWRKNVGAAAGTLPNDTDGGPIGLAQYNTWRAHFGQASIGSDSGAKRKCRRARTDKCIAAPRGSAGDVFSPWHDCVINSSTRDSGQQPTGIRNGSEADDPGQLRRSRLRPSLGVNKPVDAVASWHGYGVPGN